MSADRWSLRRVRLSGSPGLPPHVWVVFPPGKIAKTQSDPLRWLYATREIDPSTMTPRIGYVFGQGPGAWDAAVAMLRDPEEHRRIYRLEGGTR